MGRRIAALTVVLLAAVACTASAAPASAQAAELTGASQLSTGNESSCVVVGGGHVACWGFGWDGELGNGEQTTQATPVEVANISTATQVSVGVGVACARLQSGHLMCWGAGREGELGNGEPKEWSSTPVEVSGITNATQVSAGDEAVCALLSSGHIDCWGSGSLGQIGNGEKKAINPTPVEVSGITTATEVSSGTGHSCALLSSGHIKCWGWGEWGSLGDGTTESDPLPVEVLGVTDATQVSGRAATCALLATGHVKCWGVGQGGEMGNGEAKEDNPTPIEVPGIAGATQVSSSVTECVRLSTGHLDCWGFAAYGQLGNGEKPYDALSPVEVPGISDASEVGTGGLDVCTRLSTGHVDCWGAGNAGQLGDGSTEESLTPVPVLELRELQSVSFSPPQYVSRLAAPFTVSAKASSGLPVTLSASGVCTVNATTGQVTLSGKTGSCELTVNQAGNSEYQAASATRVITVRNPTTAALKPSSAAAKRGKAVKLTVTVTARVQGRTKESTVKVGSGSVRLLVGGVEVASVSVVKGKAAFSYTPPADGTFPVEVIYGGSGGEYEQSSATGSLTVTG